MFEFDGSGIRLCDRMAEAALSWRASLIVIGTHGRRGLGRLMPGSDAEQMLRVAPVPVLPGRGDTTREAA